MGETFTCSCCGKEHSGPITDWAFTLPDVVWDIPEAERSDKAQFTSDLCQYGERYFIRAMLEIPLGTRPGYFGWGAWAEVEWPAFERYLQVYDVDALSEPRYHGRLANDLPAYTPSLGTPILLQFREATKRPAMLLPSGASSPLAIEQRNGIDGRRYHEILHSIAVD